MSGPKIEYSPDMASVYKVTEYIGEGINSEVFRAVKSIGSGLPDQVVALKKFKSWDDVQDFQKYFNKISKVRSFYCSNILGWEVYEGQPTLVLDWIEGISLSRLLKYTDLSHDMIQYIVCEIQKGLQDLHKVGVVHGDLSPDNIMIDISGKIKLIDYGFYETQNNRFINPYFLSPEVWGGHALSDGSDLYSLAIIQYWMINQIEFGSIKPREFSEQFLNQCEWTQKEPHLRHYKSINSNNFSTFLSNAVSRIVLQQTKIPKTVSFPHSFDSQVKLIKKSKKRLVISALFALLMFSPLRIQSQMANFKRSTLIITSHLWKEIRVNGKKMGVTPLRIEGIAPGRYKVEWKNNIGSGQVTINMPAGSKIVLNDKILR